MFQKLFPWLSPKGAAATFKLPKTKSSVEGFSIEVIRKEECILRSRPKDSAEDVPYTDIGNDWHLEVVVTYDGSNTLYPDLRPGMVWRRFLTNALSESAGVGMVGSMNYCGPNERYSLLEVVEAFEDYRNCDIIGGGIPLPEYVVWLKVYVSDKKGERNCFSAGLTSRPEHPGQPRYIPSRGVGTLI